MRYEPQVKDAYEAAVASDHHRFAMITGVFLATPEEMRAWADALLWVMHGPLGVGTSPPEQKP